MSGSDNQMHGMKGNEGSMAAIAWELACLLNRGQSGVTPSWLGIQRFKRMGIALLPSILSMHYTMVCINSHDIERS